MINLVSSKMTSNQDFETDSSINSDEDIKLITIHSFNTHFHCEIEFQGTSTTNLINNANPPIPSPNYKFMGLTYTTEEFEDESQSKVNCSFPVSETKQFICPIPKRLRQKKRKMGSCSLSPRNLFNFQENHQEQDPNLHINLMNISDLPKIIRQNKHFSTNTLQSTNPLSPKKGQKNFPSSNREVKMPSSILKSSSFDFVQYESQKNLLNVSHQILRVPNKKVSFELTKEQKRKLKQKSTNLISSFAKQKTKFLKN